MSDKINIEIYKNKNPDELSRLLSDADSPLGVGSAAAVSAAMAAGLLCRAAALTAREIKNDLRLDYIVRNAEVMRSYMVYLIDEDVKCRTPFLKALQGEAEDEKASLLQPAVSISAGIIDMMSQCLGLMAELSELCGNEAIASLGEAAHLAMGAISACRVYIIDLADRFGDEAYRSSVRRENELSLQRCKADYEKLLSRVESLI